MTISKSSHNISSYVASVSAFDKAMIMNQKPICIWLTGLSGAGKSTIANELESQLFQLNRHTVILDGDNLRHGLCSDLGFTEQDRTENVRRVAEVARLMQQAGLIVIVAFISPFRKQREFARSLFERGDFFEIYINTPMAVCEKRDPKGLYSKARKGDIEQFTGIDSPYEEPTSPELTIDTSMLTLNQAVELILNTCNIVSEIHDQRD